MKSMDFSMTGFTLLESERRWIATMRAVHEGRSYPLARRLIDLCLATHASPDSAHRSFGRAEVTLRTTHIAGLQLLTSSIEVGALGAGGWPADEDPKQVLSSPARADPRAPSGRVIRTTRRLRRLGCCAALSEIGWCVFIGDHGSTISL